VVVVSRQEGMHKSSRILTAMSSCLQQCSSPFPKSMLPDALFGVAAAFVCRFHFFGLGNIPSRFTTLPKSARLVRLQRRI
jgi:hypothetical protein